MDIYSDNIRSPSIGDCLSDDENLVINVPTLTINQASFNTTINASSDTEKECVNNIVGLSVYRVMEHQPFQDHLPNFSVPASYQPNIHYLSPNVQIDRQLPHASTHGINETVDASSSLVYQSSEPQPYPETYIQPPSFPIHGLQIPHCNQSVHSQSSGLLVAQPHLLQSQSHNEFAPFFDHYVQQPYQTVTNYMLRTPVSYQLDYNPPNMQMLQTQPLPTAMSAESVTASAGSSEGTSVHNETFTSLPNAVPRESVDQDRPDDRDLDDTHEYAFMQEEEEEQGHLKHSEESEVQCDLNGLVSEQQSALTLTNRPDPEQTKEEACRQNDAERKKIQLGLRDKKYSCQNNMVKHERIDTGVKLYQCNTCDKKFSQLSNLKKHMRIHSGEKPYKCSSCDKKFFKLWDLKMHMRIHTGEKPYQCKVCHRKFSQSQHLKTHERIHTGEKPYQCKLCHKNFSLKYSLKIHERIHTSEK